jgi:hypothetical protein
MIDIVLYHVHVVAFVYAFVRRWQEEGIKGGAIAVSLCALVFIILWSITGPIARWIMPDEPLAGQIFTRDTLSLILAIIPEAVFFVVFFLRAGRSGGVTPPRQVV